MPVTFHSLQASTYLLNFPPILFKPGTIEEIVV
jgi:hypothetical protein